MIRIHYDTSLLVGKTIDQCNCLIDAFNLNLTRAALVILRKERDTNNLARRALINAKINPDNPDLLEELIQTDGICINVQEIRFIDQFIGMLTYNTNRINVSAKITQDNQVRIDKILSRG